MLAGTKSFLAAVSFPRQSHPRDGAVRNSVSVCSSVYRPRQGLVEKGLPGAWLEFAPGEILPPDTWYGIP